MAGFRATAVLVRAGIVFTAIAVAGCTSPVPRPSQAVTLSIVGTNDVHGQLAARDDRGGLETIAAYVNALRATRNADGGAVVLLDAGDMWQGTLESNLGEGAAVVAAYNAMQYAAVAVGNHEFDFGPVGDLAIPKVPTDDPRGALKQRAREAQFPLLAANLFDKNTDAPVNWPNVQPSILLDVHGVKVGVLGVMSSNALRATIAANVVGLRIAPLAASIEREAMKLRSAGATLVIVVAHAGGRCEEFDDPLDLSSCNQRGEIFQAARALPRGLVDHIVAGHVHQGIAHEVNGTAITSSYSNTAAFSRVDFLIDRNTEQVVGRTIFPPQDVIAGAPYAGRPTTADTVVTQIAVDAIDTAKQLRQREIGVTLERAFTLEGNPESALGNLFTDALLQSFDADVAIHNVAGGLRTDLPAGNLTFGSIYEISPFENRIVILELTGAELRRVIAAQAPRGNRSIGFSGMRVQVHCDDETMRLAMRRTDDSVIEDNDVVRVVANDYVALGGDNVLAPIMPPAGFALDDSLPLTRDTFVEWLRQRGGTLDPADFLTDHAPKWTRPARVPSSCRLSN